jgi:hypothetical protein
MPTVLLVVALLAVVPRVYASERVDHAGNVPFYARILPGDAWTAIIFYRPLSCVPKDFDLFMFFDIPRAFGCGPATTDGFAIWRNGPEVDVAPLQLDLHGLRAVPIYFVKTAELDAAAADGVLTMREVEALPSLMVGTATTYHEILHPVEGARVAKITVVASGTLADGRSFRFQVSNENRNYHAQIVFE